MDQPKTGIEAVAYLIAAALIALGLAYACSQSDFAVSTTTTPETTVEPVADEPTLPNCTAICAGLASKRFGPVTDDNEFDVQGYLAGCLREAATHPEACR